MRDTVLDEHALFRQPPTLPVHFPDDRVARAHIVVGISIMAFIAFCSMVH
jgi:hypothetical protein